MEVAWEVILGQPGPGPLDQEEQVPLAEVGDLVLGDLLKTTPLEDYLEHHNHNSKTTISYNRVLCRRLMARILCFKWETHQLMEAIRRNQLYPLRHLSLKKGKTRRTLLF